MRRSLAAKGSVTLTILGLLALGVVFAAVIVFASEAPVLQPIAFNHALHLSKDLDCSYCHEHVESSPYATLPANEVCLGCHQTPLGTSAEEEKLRQLAAKGPLAWVRVNRLPGHVYFSHRAHVTWGKVDCATCHGDMRRVSQPVSHSQIKGLTMAACIGCHRARHARTDCVTCHK